jgi:hypothetical protein
LIIFTHLPIDEHITNNFPFLEVLEKTVHKPPALSDSGIPYNELIIRQEKTTNASRTGNYTFSTAISFPPAFKLFQHLLTTHTNMKGMGQKTP